jgi:hypothetical protein
MDVGQILLGAGIVLVVLYLVGRTQRRSQPTAPATSRRIPAGRQPLTRLEDVVPIPAPAGWLALPAPPSGLDGEPEERAHVEVGDRPYARTTCPSCSVELDPLPKAKKRCPSCRDAIYVRSGPDDRRYLLSVAELESFQERWAVADMERWAQAERRQAAALVEWHGLLSAAGFAVGPQDLDVVGESFYRAALAGIHAALHPTGSGFEVRASAMLKREPDNAYDQNAIGVYIHGAKVGHLDRYDAEDYQPLLKRSGGSMWVQAVVMGGRMTPAGEIGPIGVKLDDIPAAAL